MPVPHARLCFLKKWETHTGYGFSLHGTPGVVGHFIDDVDPDSPAFAGGLRDGDCLVEVNGRNILSDTHSAVVAQIRSNPDQTCLLVVDPEAKDYFDRNHIVIDGYMQLLDRMYSGSFRSVSNDVHPPVTEENRIIIHNATEAYAARAYESEQPVSEKVELSSPHSEHRSPAGSVCSNHSDRVQSYDEFEVRSRSEDPAIQSTEVNQDGNSAPDITASLETGDHEPVVPEHSDATSQEYLKNVFSTLDEVTEEKPNSRRASAEAAKVECISTGRSARISLADHQDDKTGHGAVRRVSFTDPINLEMHPSDKSSLNGKASPRASIPKEAVKDSSADEPCCSLCSRLSSTDQAELNPADLRFQLAVKRRSKCAPTTSFTQRKLLFDAL